MFLLPIRSRFFSPIVVHKYQRKVVFEIFTSRSSWVVVIWDMFGFVFQVSAPSVFIFSPSTCILPKFIYQSSSIHTFQNFSFVVISVTKDRLHKVAGQTKPARKITGRVAFSCSETRNCSPHCSAELFVGHAAVVFLFPPQLSYSLRFQEPKDALRPVFPLD